MDELFKKWIIKKCPICEKEFWKREQWIYKRQIRSKRVYYCSWTCMRKHEHMDPKIMKKNKKYR